MVRTGSTAVRASGGKSAKAVAKNSSTRSAAPSSSSNDKASGGGNSVCPRETPNWQKPINSFFKKVDIEEARIQEINKCKADGNTDNNNYDVQNNNKDVNSNENSMDACAGPSTSNDSTSLPGPSRASPTPGRGDPTSVVTTNMGTEADEERDGDKENSPRLSQKRSNNSEEDLPAKKLKPAFYKHLEDFECFS